MIIHESKGIPVERGSYVLEQVIEGGVLSLTSHWLNILKAGEVSFKLSTKVVKYGLHHFFFFYILCLTDIGSWLELFGFQLHNVLPGFPKPELENLELTYELLQLQTKTQEWDPGKVCKNFTISVYLKKQTSIQHHEMALTYICLLIFELS